MDKLRTKNKRKQTCGLSTDVSRKFKYEKMPASMLCGDGISPFSIIVSRTFIAIV
jgi:hypothetical protein